MPEYGFGFGEGVDGGGGEELVGAEIASGEAQDGAEKDDGVEGGEDVDGTGREGDMSGAEVPKVFDWPDGGAGGRGSFLGEWEGWRGDDGRLRRCPP